MVTFFTDHYAQNYINQYGLSPLMIAVRCNSAKMVHVFMKNGAIPLSRGKCLPVPAGTNRYLPVALNAAARCSGRTVLHWCVVHGCDALVTIIVQYIQEGVGDGLRVARQVKAL